MNRILIGSSDECDIIFKGNYISPKHLEISYYNNVFFVEDLDSKFGTLLNGKKLTKKQQFNLNDKVKIGTQLVHLSEEVLFPKDRKEESKITFEDFFSIKGEVNFHDYRWSLLLLIIAFLFMPFIIVTYTQSFFLLEELTILGYLVVIYVTFNLSFKLLRSKYKSRT